MELALLIMTLTGVVIIALLRTLSRRLDSIQARQDVLMRHLGCPDDEPSDEVRELAQDPARRIDAIKLYRQQTGHDLKAAVEAIDRLA